MNYTKTPEAYLLEWQWVVESDGNPAKMTIFCFLVVF